MSSEPHLPTAYCAPGRKLAAALTLMFKVEDVAEIREHPWLEGSSDVLVIDTAEIERVDWPVISRPELPSAFDQKLCDRISPRLPIRLSSIL